MSLTKLTELSKKMKELKEEYDKTIEAYISANIGLIEAAYSKKGVSTGTVDVAIGNEIVKFSRAKSVSYNQEKMATMVRAIVDSGHDPARFGITTEYSIKETVFKAMPDEQQKYFLEAREEKQGKLTIKLGEEK